MRRLMVIAALFSVSLLAVRVGFEAFVLFPPGIKSASMEIKVQDERDEMVKDNQSNGLNEPEPAKDWKIAPVFDITGAVMSDPTGTMLNANPSGVRLVSVGKDMKIAPLFDVTGAVVSDPTGTMLNTNLSGNKPVSVGRDMKIAPVFDTTGAITSDPTGTILGAAKP